MAPPDWQTLKLGFTSKPHNRHTLNHSLRKVFPSSLEILIRADVLNFGIPKLINVFGLGPARPVTEYRSYQNIQKGSSRECFRKDLSLTKTSKR